jgi:hypothetical protein
MLNETSSIINLCEKYVSYFFLKIFKNGFEIISKTEDNVSADLKANVPLFRRVGKIYVVIGADLYGAEVT